MIKKITLFLVISLITQSLLIANNNAIHTQQTVFKEQLLEEITELILEKGFLTEEDINQILISQQQEDNSNRQTLNQPIIIGLITCATLLCIVYAYSSINRLEKKTIAKAEKLIQNELEKKAEKQICSITKNTEKKAEHLTQSAITHITPPCHQAATILNHTIQNTTQHVTQELANQGNQALHSANNAATSLAHVSTQITHNVIEEIAQFTEQEIHAIQEAQRQAREAIRHRQQRLIHNLHTTHGHHNNPHHRGIASFATAQEEEFGTFFTEEGCRRSRRIAKNN